MKSKLQLEAYIKAQVVQHAINAYAHMSRIDLAKLAFNSKKPKDWDKVRTK